MNIEKVNPKQVTYGSTIGPNGRSDINAVRQVGGLAVASYFRAMRWRSMRWRSMRWRPKRRSMTKTGKFGAVAGTIIFLGASYLLHTKLYGGAVAQFENFWCQFPYSVQAKIWLHFRVLFVRI